MIHARPGLVAAAVLIALSGCGTEDLKPAAQCFPKEALRWMAPVSAKAASAIAKPQIAKATIYVDRSGSMAGYVDGATNTERPLQDIVSTLPSVLELQEVKTEFRTFGSSVSEPLADDGASLRTRDLFACRAIPGQPCDNTESHLDQVLSRASRESSELAIVVSDLWFSNSEIDSTGIAALQPALIDILKSGRVIAIYGIDAPFAGKIYDLPDRQNGTFSVPFRGRHPLYMLVVGPKSAVVAFGDGLTASGSNFLANGIATGKIVRSLFATDPGPDVYPEAEPLSKSRDPRITPDYSPVPQGVKLQRFALTSGPLGRPAKTAPGVPKWTGPNPAYFLKDAVWRGPTAGQTRSWEQGSNPCAWNSQGTRTDGWSQDGDFQQSFALDPDKLRTTLARKGTYLLVGESRRRELAQPNPASDWMRGPWNLAPEAASAVARNAPPIFPTLNLSEFGRIMESALAIATRERNQPIVGFAVMVTVKD